MRNITVSVDDETYRRARMKAAELDTSVSRLVRDYLNELATGATEHERLRLKEAELRAQIEEFTGGNRLSRDELYERQQ
jgi:spermidine synthase